MKIDKLKTSCMGAFRTQLTFKKKINELIDLVNENTKEIQKGAEVFNERHDVISDIANELLAQKRELKLHVEALDNHSDRIDKLESAGKEKKEPELLPCPFCNGNAIEVIHDGAARVECRGYEYMNLCIARCCTKWFCDLDDAFQAWNKRA